MEEMCIVRLKFLCNIIILISGVGFGAYCAVDFALVMDVLPNDREKAKDLAVWHQVNINLLVLAV